MSCHRIGARVACAAAVLVLNVFSASSIYAQNAGQEAAVMASRYAPILWLGPGEPAYPMRPFPFAFDGIDNDEDGCYDLADPDEIDAIRYPEGLGKADKKKYLEDVEALLTGLRDLRLAARNATASETPEQAVRKKADALERLVKTHTRNVGCTQGTSNLGHFKLCEEFDGHLVCGPEPAVFYRYEEKVTPDMVEARELRRKHMSAMQYWLYYPWDDEHLHDGEHVSVFFNPLGVQAVVGAGHLPSTANNVLALMDGRPYPTEIPEHMPILVEMGKHSSAPDFNCNGIFDVGQDANYLPTGAWGTRDINYAIGKSQWGKYDATLSFDRTRGELLIEKNAESDVYARSCAEQSLGGTLLRKVVAIDRSAAVAQALVTDLELGSNADRYGAMRFALLDAFTFEAILAGGRDGLEQRLFDNQQLLFPNSRQPWKTAEAVAIDPVFAERVRELHDAKPGSGARPDVWRHSDFGKYGNDFKTGLFRSWSWGPSYTNENGNTRLGAYLRLAPRSLDSSFELHIWTERVPGLLNQAVENANASAEGRLRRNPVEMALFYNSFSTSYQGLYLGGSFRSSDLRYSSAYQVARGTPAGQAADTVVRTRVPGNVFLEAGYSAAVPVLDKIPLLPRKWKEWLEVRPLQFRIGVTAPLTWDDEGYRSGDDGNQALRADDVQQGVEMRFNVQLRISNVGRFSGGHPLSTRQPPVDPQRKGHWGVTMGARAFRGTATLDYSGTSTPAVGTSGPYQNAVITVDRVWRGGSYSFGYRGPFRDDGRLGFGAGISYSPVGDGHLERRVTGLSETGTPVTFLYVGGTTNLKTAALIGHLSYNLFGTLNLMAGGRLSALSVRTTWGGYGADQCCTAVAPSSERQTFREWSILPWVGTEVFLRNYVSVDATLEFLPTKTRQFATTPAGLSFVRDWWAASASLRLLF